MAANGACSSLEVPLKRGLTRGGKFIGERVHDVHLRIADKRAARADGGATTDD